jgi:hypothetical protein
VGEKFSDYEGIICINEHTGVFPLDIFDRNWQRIGDRTYLVFEGTAQEKETRLVTSWLDGDSSQVVIVKPTNIDATYNPEWGDNGNGEGAVTVIDNDRITSFQATTTSSTVPAHRAVYTFGPNPSTGLLNMSESDIDGPSTLPVIGITSTDIPPDGVGTVITSGPIAGFNTNAWSIGDPLYVKFSGELTNVKQLKHPQPLATVTEVGILDGSILVNIQSLIGIPIKVLSAASFAAQIPSGTDAPLQIELGAAQGLASDPVQLSALGAITINERSLYQINIELSVRRTSSVQEAIIFGRMLINSVQSGPPIALIINLDDMTIPMQFTIFQTFDVGDVLTFEIYRDSNGSNNGQLDSFASTIGWGDSPSAAITMLKF